MNRNAFPRLSLLSIIGLLAACPGGDPDPAGHPVTKPAPEEPVKAPLVVPSAVDQDVVDVVDRDVVAEPEPPADIEPPAPPPEDR